MEINRRLLPIAACLALTLGACGAKAAEPAESPPLAVAPAGRIVVVGEQAEGIVADPVTHLVAVGVRNPDGLVLFDGRTGAPTARVALPGHLRHLDLAGPGGPVLVADEDSGALVSIGLPAGERLSTVPIGRYPHAAVRESDGTLVVADELGGAVVVVRDGGAVHRFTDGPQPGGLAVVGGLVAAIDVRDRTLSLYDTRREVRVGQVMGGDGPTHLVADRHGRLQVVDTRGGRLLTFQVTPKLRRIAITPLGGTPYGITYDTVRDRLWVTLTGLNQVVGLDLAGAAPAVVSTFPTIRQPNTVAVDAATGRVFVAGRADGTVQLIDPPA
ncbi:MAG: YncE family protein [Actinoplanes sp.]